jgi:light-regulated signal transduction histidine kinase (bacteriophytochrome)
MTHAHLRAMSPIHLKYLSNMGVRSSMSISICAFGGLWGLVALHNYGRYGKRVNFPVRERVAPSSTARCIADLLLFTRLCKLLGDSISRNIERLSYARRIHSRKLINTTPTASNPSGYIVANGDDLLVSSRAEADEQPMSPSSCELTPNQSLRSHSLMRISACSVSEKRPR